jgi:hypothetical protein
VNDTCIKLIYRMILAAMAREPTEELYQQYLRERYMYVTIAEILEAKERTA